MSQENVQRLRRLYDEWAKGNLWALRDIADPNLEWEWSPGLASLSGGARIYRGLEEIGSATLEFLGAWNRYWITADEFIEMGEEVVVVLMRLHAQAAGTDTVLEARSAGVWTFRNGKAVRARYYDDQAEALKVAAAGQSEPTT
jgi:ketosteroid isomerase-like protein